MLTAWTRDLFQAIGDIGLSARVKLHVRIDRKAVAAFEADTAALAVRLKSPSIDTERIRFADCALYARQPLFDLFKSNKSHQPPIVY